MRTRRSTPILLTDSASIDEADPFIALCGNDGSCYAVTTEIVGCDLKEWVKVLSALGTEVSA